VIVLAALVSQRQMASTSWPLFGRTTTLNVAA
jgi:hypothetical protein